MFRVPESSPVAESSPMAEISIGKSSAKILAAKNQESTPADASFLRGDGEMHERIRLFDWSSTPIGPIKSWSPTLCNLLSILLANRFPMLLWWGPHYISLYNDAYIPILGVKHPTRALGRPVSECWSEIWPILKPLIDTPFRGGPATWQEDIQLEINRHDFVEETHFTISYSPVPDDSVPSGIGGVLAIVHETTDEIIGKRRITVLRDVSAKLIEAKSAEEVCQNAANILATHDQDVPFALFYLIDADRKCARLAATTATATNGEDDPASPRVIELGKQDNGRKGWPLAEAVRQGAMQIVEGLAERFGDLLPPGPWSDAPHQAVVVPIRSNSVHPLAGLLVVGVSSRQKLDDAYRSFIELITTQLATAIATARAAEEDRRRAALLAELNLETRNARRAALNVMEDAIQSRFDAEALNIEIEASEARYRTLFNSMDEGYCIIQMIFDQHEKPVDYVYLEVNPAFEKLTGMHDARGKRISEFVPDLEEHWFETYGRVALTGEPIRVADEVKGMNRWFDIYACRVGDPKDRKLAVLFTNITERKQIESNLINAMAVAEKANQAKSEFLSNMSHELRSPLNAVLGFAQLLESDATPQTASQKESTRHILKAGWYLLDLINEILDLALVDSGKLLLSIEAMPLDEVLLDCQAMIESQAKKRNLQLSFPQFDTPCFIAADRKRVKQIFLNLLSNAIKYNKEGGTVVVECTAVSSERLRISVKDTGAGLSPENLAQLFQPFNRLGQETSGTEGTGIGLVMTKRLVEMMGGSIGVESKVGVGTMFWIELPFANDQHGELAAARVLPVSVPRDDAGRTVLCVEDDAANLALIAQLIARRPNMYLLSATNAALGIELAREHQPEVILMDINLPGISGIEALHILRDDPLTKRIPVVAVSASAMPQDVEQGLALGFFRYLAKPIKVNEFLEALDTALEFSSAASRSGEKRIGPRDEQQQFS